MVSAKQVQALQNKSTANTSQLPRVLGALRDQARRGFFRLLVPGQNLCLTDMVQLFNLSDLATSEQLKMLELAGLVSPARRGQLTCYWVKAEDSLVTQGAQDCAEYYLRSSKV